MPTYEFRCTNGHVFDEFHKISDAPTTATCPTCGAAAERVISGGAGLLFKGSGFYLTDYGKNAHRSSGPAAKSGESSGGGEGGKSSSESSSAGTSSSSSASTNAASTPSSSPGSASTSGTSSSSSPKGSSGGAKE